MSHTEKLNTNLFSQSLIPICQAYNDNTKFYNLVLGKDYDNEQRLIIYNNIKLFMVVNNPMANLILSKVVGIDQMLLQKTYVSIKARSTIQMASHQQFL